MDKAIDFDETGGFMDQDGQMDHMNPNDNIYGTEHDGANVPHKSRNPHIRGAHSEEPNTRNHGQLHNDMHGTSDGHDDGSDPNARQNKFKDAENARRNVLNDSSPTKSKAIKTMSLGREIRKKQFRDYPKPLSAEQTMNFIVESFLEGDEGYCLDPKHVILPGFEEARHSNKNNGMIEAYAANTNQGVFRNYNEDRVSIILNITKPTFKEVDDWPTCSFFAVYDGHGGSSCADFLRDNLHQFIVKQESFPSDPVTAIRDGFDEAEKFFLEIQNFLFVLANR